MTKKQQVLKELKETRTINTDMLKTIKMSFEVWLRYASLSDEVQQKVVDKAIKKLESAVL
jgi:uncharacterized protein with PQ loop repeat